MKPAKKQELKSVTHSVRASQAVLQYGVGAMVDFPDQTLMTAAPEYWQENVADIHDERLEKVLKVEYFGMPRGKGERHTAGISYSRFPEWYFCPKCRKFQPLTKWIDEYKHKASAKVIVNDPYMVKHMQCLTCKQELVVARVLVACQNGHIDDFPWINWVHYRNIGGSKNVCEHPSLKFKTSASSTEGLEGIVITCENCHAKASLKGAFDPDIFSRLDKKSGKCDFRCRGRHPWKNTTETCEKYPRAIQRGSSSVYFPVTVSSLVIPPFSDLMNTKIEASNAFKECRTTLSKIPSDIRTTILQAQLSQWSNEIALETGLPEDSVNAVLARKWCHEAEEEYTTQSVKYRAAEYEALNGTASIISDISRDFARESMDISRYNIPYVVNVSLINKIREVQALTGFSRLQPVEWSGQPQYPEGFVSIKEKDTRWYPAYEVRGEGIFIEFDQEAIHAWVTGNDAVQKRVDNLNGNYSVSFLGQNHPRKITAKFLMLHTIAHLLIKQLSFECGYSIASLKERIYCSEASEGKEMAGIFIYTASGDSEGTMGGLVRQGRPDCLPRIFRKALESAITCSNDPVCSLSNGQGRDSLNLAACYSCALIPETSCEEYNIFLDRGVLIGTFNNRNIGFFSSYVYGNTSIQNLESKQIAPEKSKREQPVNGITDAVHIQHNGTKLSNMSFQDIWTYALDSVDAPCERETFLLTSLIKMSSELVPAEDPLFGETVHLILSNETVETDLIWEQAKVMLFLSDNKENYQKAKNSNWTCLYTNDPELTAHDVIASIIGEKL